MRHRFIRHMTSVILFTVTVLLLSTAAAGQRSVAGTTTSDGSAGHRGGNRIAFSRQLESGGSAGFTTDRRGNRERQIAIPEVGEDFGRTVWSHRGDRMLFSNIPTYAADGALIGFRPGISAPDGSRFHLLALPDRPVDMYCSAWTPDDRRVVCGDEVGLFTMRASDGGGVDRLTRNPFHGQDLAIGYSPRRHVLAFIRTNPGDPSNDNDDTAALLLARPDGTHLRTITPDGLLLPHELAGGDWSPDGRHVASTTATGRLVIISVHSKQVRTVPLRVQGDYFAAVPTYSPNGNRLTFSLFRGAPADIYTARLDGGGLVHVTHTPNVNELYPDWKPAGRHDKRST